MNTGINFGKNDTPQVPQVEERCLPGLLEAFGVRASHFRRLAGYDDRNYHVCQPESLRTNSRLGGVPVSGYLLKITNPMEAAIDGLLDGQVSFASHLKDNGFSCPEPIQRCDGLFWKSERIPCLGAPDIDLPVRLFKFLPGEVLAKSAREACNHNFFISMGLLIGKMHKTTETFHHPVYDSFRSHWSLSSAPAVEELAFVLPDPADKRLVSTVFDQFKTHVHEHESNFQHGQIHGDLNENNILVRETSSGDWEVCGILDLCDSHHSCLVYDLGIAICYMMLLEQEAVAPEDIGGLVLAGYLRLRALSDAELRAIFWCLSARLAQSLVYGFYMYHKNPSPDNVYVLETQRKGWSLLRRLQKTPIDTIMTRWQRIIESNHSYN